MIRRFFAVEAGFSTLLTAGVMPSHLVPRPLLALDDLDLLPCDISLDSRSAGLTAALMRQVLKNMPNNRPYSFSF